MVQRVQPVDIFLLYAADHPGVFAHIPVVAHNEILILRNGKFRYVVQITISHRLVNVGLVLQLAVEIQLAALQFHPVSRQGDDPLDNNNIINIVVRGDHISSGKLQKGNVVDPEAYQKLAVSQSGIHGVARNKNGRENRKIKENKYQKK